MRPFPGRWDTVAFLVGAVAVAASLGLLSGWLTGQSGPDHAVTAAVIPAVLSIGGVFVFLRGANEGGSLHRIVAPLFVVVFCISFFLAVDDGAEQRDRDIARIAKEAEEKHLRHLEACSKAEEVFNRARAVKKLEPLDSEYFCRRLR